jgi:hypothetical protein
MCGGLRANALAASFWFGGYKKQWQTLREMAILSMLGYLCTRSSLGRTNRDWVSSGQPRTTGRDYPARD